MNKYLCAFTVNITPEEEMDQPPYQLHVHHAAINAESAVHAFNLLKAMTKPALEDQTGVSVRVESIVNDADQVELMDTNVDPPQLR